MKKTFSYTKTNYIYIKEYKDNKWQEGYFTKDDNITISAMSTSLHYGQQIFEGIKAYRRKDGNINLFRIKDNAKRFNDSARRLVMPEIDESLFIDIVKEVVIKNEDHLGSHNLEEALYIRPLMIGVGPKLGVGPSDNYLLIVTASPVGSYFSSKTNVLVTDYDRAAPNGTGDVKAGANYGMSLFALTEAKAKGYNDCLFLDAKTKTKVEEVGAANFYGIKNNKYYTPKSNTILPSITNLALRQIAKDLGLEVIDGDILVNDLKTFDEVGACGTGALITYIRSITNGNERYEYLNHPISKKLKEELLNIQYGLIEDRHNWITLIKVRD